MSPWLSGRPAALWVTLEIAGAPSAGKLRERGSWTICRRSRCPAVTCSRITDPTTSPFTADLLQYDECRCARRRVRERPRVNLPTARHGCQFGCRAGCGPRDARLTADLPHAEGSTFKLSRAGSRETPEADPVMRHSPAWTSTSRSNGFALTARRSLEPWNQGRSTRRCPVVPAGVSGG